MDGPYRMVVISFLSLLLVAFGIFFYQNIFPKKKLPYLVLIFLVSIPPIVSIFRPGVYESGDFSIHIYRTISFFNSLQEGHLLPSWAGQLNATYGYPLFIFNYSLPYYMISLIHLFSTSYILSMKIFLVVTYIFSGIFMYLFARNIYKNDLAGFMAAVFYQFVPYHLIDEHFKVVIGELLVFTIIPISLLFIQKSYSERSGKYIALAGITIALLIMSHVVLALFAMLLFFAYSIFIAIEKVSLRIILKAILIFILGSIASMYVWLTPFFLIKYTLFQKEQTPVIHFPRFIDLLFSPWRLGFLFQGPQGQISDLIGYSQIFVFFVLVILFINKKIPSKYKHVILFWLICFVFLIFLITPFSHIFWTILPFIKNTGPHRLLLILAFVTSILGGYFALIMLHKQRLIFILISFTIISTILNWGQRRVIPTIYDSSLKANLWKSTSEGEGHFYANSEFRDPRHPWFSKLPSAHLQVTKGNGNIQDLSRSSVKHTYLVTAATQLSLQENTLYFPGWQIVDNNRTIPISHNQNAVITFTLPKGNHYIEVAYSDVPIYKVLKWTSIGGLFLLLVYLLILALKQINIPQLF